MEGYLHAIQFSEFQLFPAVEYSKLSFLAINIKRMTRVSVMWAVEALTSTLKSDI